MWSDDLAAGEPTVQQLLEVYRVKKQTAATKVPIRTFLSMIFFVSPAHLFTRTLIDRLCIPFPSMGSTYSKPRKD